MIIGGKSMKLLYGTVNTAKIKHMKDMLKGLEIEIIGLNDVNVNVSNIDESGNNPLENAKIKAMAYFKEYKEPVFSCDSGLYIEGIDDNSQPGVHVRRVNGKVLNDEEMIEYYTRLAMQNGGEVKAKYKNAIALILDEDTIYAYDGDDISSELFIITSKPHEKRNPGFPLDSISVEIKSKKYYLDLDIYETNYDNKIAEGFRNFFMNALTYKK